MDKESPLVKALPPESDYLTYLTVVEYNLTRDNLPTLHAVLQDEKLTINIGWDLVYLLVPLLPDSEQCLQDVSRLGNPREVIIKVTEALKEIEYDEDTTDELPLSVVQFNTLVAMLAILHSRIKTKYPSQFFSTSLQAILASFAQATNHKEEMVLAIVKAIKSIAGVQRPALPNRKSSAMVMQSQFKSSAATDPEDTTAGAETSPAEKAMQTRLAQAFITHVLEEYLTELPESEVPGLAWCSRLMEETHPERTIPGRPTLTELFQQEKDLHRRIDAVGQLVTLSQDLQIPNSELLSASTSPETTTDIQSPDPPTSADEIPLSHTGSMLLYSARQISSILYTKPRLTPIEPQFLIFPHHHEILKTRLREIPGREVPPILDAALSLGLTSLLNDQIGSPTSDENFTSYLLTISQIASNCPSGNLRTHAHYIASNVLRSHGDESVRLEFIREILMSKCENLRPVAVGWVKTEILDPHPGGIFSSPYILETLSVALFPPLGEISLPLRQVVNVFEARQGTYLATLNLLIFLLEAEEVRERLGVVEFCAGEGVTGYLEGLEKLIERVEDVEDLDNERELLSITVRRVRELIGE
ncbi:DUF1760-domain-containing protein [Piedraia hortae CBS 480.64]|uniref:DUF1760-domain-containing protein n=1 Tax=Piedraia hortae CBS 480.64 TaxID=1314780 RepID=A0A6A7C7W6_9PEZI|nr:DUF1760-domain-containing protein [Piedraia hortae CBS 480.64]